MLKKCALRLAFCLSLMLGWAPAYSTAIAFTAVDLLDVGGDDLWQYRYTVNGSFGAFGGFNVQFDPARYTQLEDPAPAVNADWSIVITQPDAGLGTTGLYTATALTGTPSLADEFTVSFVLLGGGTPGAQPFEVFDDTFSVIEQGQTAVVSEPGSWPLMAVGLLLLSLTRRPKWLTRRPLSAA